MAEDFEDIDLEQIDKEMKEHEKFYKNYEEDALKKIVKYFDRINDKLFTFNNILIGGYFALGKLIESVSVWTILIPIANLVILLYLEYQMMEMARFESSIAEKYPDEIEKHKDKILHANLWSLFAMMTTLVVTGFFVYYLLR